MAEPYIIKKHLLRRVTLYFIISLCAAISLFPYLWMALTAFKPDSEFFSFNWIPKTITLNNFQQLFKIAPFFLYFINSLIVAVATAGLGVFFDTLAGFSFSKFNFPGKKFLFWLLLSTLMIPFYVTLIPSFIIIANFGWLNSYKALIIPGMTSAFGIFLCRQYMQTIPTELIESATIEGASLFRIYWRIILPISRPLIATLAILKFRYTWNDFVWPLVVVKNPQMRTIPLGLALLENMWGVPLWGILMAGSLLATLPVIILFICMQKEFIQGLTVGAVKG
jgi:ABC-type glycerol-3-phosphate transport system permease component